MKRIPEKPNTSQDIPHTPMRFLWRASKLHNGFFVATIVAVTVAELLGTSIPYIFRAIIDSAHGVQLGTHTIETVWKWALAFPVTIGLMFVAWRVSGFIGMEWATRITATAYESLFAYLTRHSHTYFSNRFAGSLSSKVTHASEGVQSLAESCVWNYYPTVLSLVFTTIYIAFSSGVAATLFIILIGILVPLNIYLAQYRRPHVVSYSAHATKARGYAVDAITNMAAVRQFSRVRDEIRRFNDHIATMRMLNVRQWRISEIGLSINNVIIVVFEACIILVAVHLWTSSRISVGELVMIVTLVMSVQHSLVFIGSSMNGFIRRYGEIQEGLTDIVVDHDIVDQANAIPLQVHAGQMVWQDVTFGFDSARVFENFNLTIKAGERVGLVGGSGAGKTTFVSLLLREHELEHGSITIDGQDIRGVTQDSLREHIAVVPQEPMLFHRSIRENIAYGKPNATDGEIIDVAKKAQAHAFVSALENGYDTLVGERGVKLSGGQKQRIAIARAMLKNAPLLVLDEATSALDSESEVAIQKALHELMAGKTVIAIAHRLSTLREMDRIIVLDAGKIVEDGTHDELVKHGGVYARLWEHQAGGFLVE